MSLLQEVVTRCVTSTRAGSNDEVSLALGQEVVTRCVTSTRTGGSDEVCH